LAGRGLHAWKSIGATQTSNSWSAFWRPNFPSSGHPHFAKNNETVIVPCWFPFFFFPLLVFSFAFDFSTLLLIFLSFQRVLENDENVEEVNEEEDLEEDIPKRKNRTRGRVSWRCHGGRMATRKPRPGKRSIPPGLTPGPSAARQLDRHCIHGLTWEYSEENSEEL
jgi:hypothetical protein